MEMLKVEYLKKNPGFVTTYKPEIAKVLEKRGEVKILGPAQPAPRSEKPKKKIDRDALVKEAIKQGLADKAELLELSDSQLEALVG